VAEIDIRQDTSREAKAGADSGNVIRDDDGTHNIRNMDNRRICLAKLRGIHRDIAACEIDRVVDQVVDARA
jgi:hypothetical protein